MLVTEKQYRIALELRKVDGEVDVIEVARRLSMKPEDLMRDIAELEAKGLLYKRVKQVEMLELTNEGLRVLKDGLPEERLYTNAFKCIGRSIGEFIDCIKSIGIDEDEAKIGLQYLLKGGCLGVVNGVIGVSSLSKCYEVIEAAGELRAWLKSIVEEGVNPPVDLLQILKRRRFITVVQRNIVTVSPTQKLVMLLGSGFLQAAPLVTVVTPQLYLSGGLEKAIIKRFDLSITPPKRKAARLNAYLEFLDLVRETMVSMGFEEVKGPHVEMELWNFDVLFQPQDHPAREIHDTFFVSTPLEVKPPEHSIIERTSMVHRKGWNYEWSIDRALRLVLRTQTTAVSARTIFERSSGEYRVFTIDRVFRPENLDAKHSMEFHQLDGIIVGRNVSFKELLAFFKEFSAALGIREVWFKPGYFPFTEPSVEGFIKHPELGWMEVFPGGVLRPEVMEILGAKESRAIAWGIGIDRLAMAVLGINDIRNLFSKDLEFLEKLTSPQLEYFKRGTSAKEVKVVEYPY
ncbi:MAG: phenylalanine--tRNA ligase subunit alpha [Sulfolobales archaeon]|nr:phenylalanine--tRNA ligase subunit alpha [Sulfolobales archaeon]MCX8199190.1 phenylalanine--tRNA ligase subunit alpha [Sulfolobales archaeon]MDW8170170.1 phenylalanine--tRNA ligase subunit alpha [Desulfurococcaceae archaeon]